MVVINENDSRLLIGAIDRGEAALFLGAGASASSTTRDGQPIRQGTALAKLVASRAGLPYSDESLPEVLGGSLGRRLSAVQFHAILKSEYTGVQPSKELVELLGYTWKRLYTWNIDDALENIRSGVQRRRYFNGMIDKVTDHEELEFLHVVHLHGEAIKPEHGFIFSPAEYNARLTQDKHDWYRLAASDYVSYFPIFIGSKLNEPIMSAELDRARPNPDSGLGVAFLVTPDTFTEVQLANFAARNIVTIKATLAEFVSWLKAKVGGRLTPVDVVRKNSALIEEIAAQANLTDADIRTAQSIVLHTWSDAKRRADSLQGLEKSKFARGYLQGNPPSWRLAATDIPVWLERTESLYRALADSIQNRDRCFLVYGQSGSGKTTALMQALLKYMREHEGKHVYELRSDVRSLRSALALIHRLHKDEQAIVYVSDAYIFGDALAEDLTSTPKGAITLISSARSGEWREHIQRRIGENTTPFEFQRFVEGDYGELIARLIEYVPAPRFKKMDDAERRDQLRNSKYQLLIALKEATESDQFTTVITKEYLSLPDDDCRTLALLVGLPTIARTGIASGTAREAYNRLRKKRTFEEAIAALDGIVSFGPNGRLVARHELYVRHIIDNVASVDQVVDAIVELLRTFTKYELPIVRTVGRQDGLLFKFLLNHNFVGELARHRSDIEEWLRVYSSFEIDFQLDGHFWLQYGQYLLSIGRFEDALIVLGKSISAYPDNIFAVHAYANVQLHVAARRAAYDAVTVELIGDAVRALEELHAKSFWESDEYPIVTLSERHIGALVKHGQHDLAKQLAPKYFRELENALRRSSAEPLRLARERLAHYVNSGTWFDGKSVRRVGRNRRGRR